MKRLITTALFLAVCAMFTGCASPRRGPAYGHQLEFRRQLAQSIPVREFGYTVKDLRFSKDFQEALVVFAHSDSKTRPDWEFTLKTDDFGRYRGMAMQPFLAPGTGQTPVTITVDLPAK